MRFSFGGDPGVDVLKCRRAVITKSICSRVESCGLFGGGEVGEGGIFGGLSFVRPVSMGRMVG